MDKKYLWMGGLGIFLLIGFFISLANLAGDESYYREHQKFNHLPDLQDEPTPIQHYKEKVDESVKAIENSAKIVNMQEEAKTNETSFFVTIGKSLNNMAGGTAFSDNTLGTTFFLFITFFTMYLLVYKL